jgi:hypothetical protein
MVALSSKFRRRQRKWRHACSIIVLVIIASWSILGAAIYSHVLNLKGEGETFTIHTDKTASRTSSGGTNDASAVKRSNACVDQKEPQCRIRPCPANPGSEDHADMDMNTTSPFGYAGRFVQRDEAGNRTKMRVGGSSNWESACVISRKYKFVYFHVLKSGGSTLKGFMRKSLCAEDDSCKNVDTDILRPISCYDAVKQHPEYFFWSFVRNPFSRIYSMYSMGMGGFPKSQKRNAITGGSIDTTTRTTMKDYSFEEFVLEPTTREKHTYMSPSHYVPQVNFLFDARNCPSFDFLGRIEYFDDDIKVLLKHLQVPEMDAYLQRHGGSMIQENTWGKGNKNKTLGGDLRLAYTSNKVVNMVVKSYALDFQLLGYDTDRTSVPQK